MAMNCENITELESAHDLSPDYEHRLWLSTTIFVWLIGGLSPINRALAYY
jgi:hypothetical protein